MMIILNAGGMLMHANSLVWTALVQPASSSSGRDAAHLGVCRDKIVPPGTCSFAPFFGCARWGEVLSCIHLSLRSCMHFSLLVLAFTDDDVFISLFFSLPAAYTVMVGSHLMNFGIMKVLYCHFKYTNHTGSSISCSTV